MEWNKLPQAIRIIDSISVSKTVESLSFQISLPSTIVYPLSDANMVRDLVLELDYRFCTSPP